MKSEIEKMEVIPDSSPQDGGYDTFLNYVCTRDPTSDEPDLPYPNYPWLPFWWQTAESADGFSTYETTNFWLNVNNSAANMVWWQMVFNTNILAVLNSVGWQLNTSRNYSASGASLNTARQPSLTNDIFVVASINLVNTLLTTTTVTVEVSPDNSTWTTAGQIADTTGVASNTTPMLSFVVPQGYYYRLVSSGSGTITLTSCNELSF